MYNCKLWHLKATIFQSHIPKQTLQCYFTMIKSYYCLKLRYSWFHWEIKVCLERTKLN
jgi:hypothetical protein